MLTRDEFHYLYEQGFEAAWTAFSQLQDTVTAQQTQLQTLQEQIPLLLKRLQELENRLDTDSHNSNKPPSSDGLKKKPVSLRTPSGRKPGGQKGHEGKTLSLVADPDCVVLHIPDHCAGCGQALAEIAAQQTVRRQVVDLPPLALVRTEHQVQTKVCPACGQATCAAFPPEATQTVQYGPRLKALGVYLKDFQLLPYARIASLFADLFGSSFSPGTLFACEQAASSCLSGVVACIRQAIVQAKRAHFDESGMRLMGSLHWLHVASTQTLTYYDWHKKRGKAGMDKAGVLPHFAGTAIHDGWVSYQRYACRHALCNAHHLRELTALYEQDGQEWAKAMRSLLVAIKRRVQRAGEQGHKRLSPLLHARYEAHYRKIVQQGLAANPPPVAVPGRRGRPKQSRARNLLDRLQQFERETLQFMYDFAVPFDNNLAERDIRMVKVQQKISGTFRSQEGADAFCRIRSYISTLRKQGQPVLSALEHVFLGKPLSPQF